MPFADRTLTTLSRKDYELIVSAAYIRPNMRIRMLGVEVNAGPSSFEGNSAVRIYIDRWNAHEAKRDRVFVGNLLSDGSFNPDESVTMTDVEQSYVSSILMAIVNGETSGSCYGTELANSINRDLAHLTELVNSINRDLAHLTELVNSIRIGEWA